MKVCSNCKELLPEFEFSKNKAATDGLYSYCKVCDKERHKQYYTNHAEYRRNYQKQYYTNHVEHCRNYQSEYAKKHPYYVYKLWFTQEPDKPYYGATYRYDRLSTHKYYLKNNTHHNSNLQKLYNKYGIKSLQIEKLIVDDKEWAFTLETRLIKSNPNCINKNLK